VCMWIERSRGKKGRWLPRPKEEKTEGIEINGQLFYVKGVYEVPIWKTLESRSSSPHPPPKEGEL
jgi:hypothetical protein